jgi:hypothetical protein
MQMVAWQWAVTGAVALACMGGMTFTVARMFSRRAAAPALLREATAFESAAVAGVAPIGASAFDGFAYRVPARLAGRVRVVVSDGRVSVAGPRVASGLYEAWIWIQALLLALVPAALVAALVDLDWRWLVAGVGIFAVSFGISGLGAGLWPAVGEMEWLVAGRFKAVEFPLSAVSDVKIGAGWADGGIDVVLLPIRAGIDALSKDVAVSFWGPDERGRQVRYAILIPSADDASRLAGLLGAEALAAGAGPRG